MQRIRVNAASSSYDVVVSGGCIERAAEEIQAVAGSRRIFVIADEGALGALGDRLERSLAVLNPTLLPIRLGEERKRLAAVEELADEMHRAGADRSAVVVTFGGGIVGDLGGFVAASYMRGISFVQIPTTLLAQVDASVGGKTGVNLSSGKNLVGAFHQPLLVLIDPQTLATLPAQEYRAGLFEVIKHGIIWSPELFAVLEGQRDAVIAREPTVLEKIVADSVRIKASVVSEDERESGLRRILNYGHTLGHGLEAETGYQTAAARRSRRLGYDRRRPLGRIAGHVFCRGPRPRRTAHPELRPAARLGRSRSAGGCRPHPRRQEDHRRQGAFRPAHGHRQGRSHRQSAGRQSPRGHASGLRSGGHSGGGAMSLGSTPVGVSPGDEEAASRNIREMFGRVAPRYDLLNRLLSGRVDVYWRNVLVASVREYLDRPDAQVLDLCCGTGDVIVALEKERDRRAGARRTGTIGSDFSRPMLTAAQDKLMRKGRAVRLIEADGLRFPAADNSYDVITIAFGFRNFANYRRGVVELHRLLRPGGCLAILECSQPPNRLWGPIFDWYFRNVLPKIGNAMSGAGDAYSYLQRSVERFFSPDELAEEMKRAGLERVRFRRLTGGISCLHLGYKRDSGS